MADLPTQPQPSEPERLLSLRATVVLLAVLTGVAAGVLAHLAGQPVAAAVLVGGGAAGAALALFTTSSDTGRWPNIALLPPLLPGSSSRFLRPALSISSLGSHFRSVRGWSTLRVKSDYRARSLLVHRA